MVEYEQQPQSYGEGDYYEQPLSLQSPASSKVFSLSPDEEDFLKELFRFETERLIHSWRGDKKNVDGEWVVNEDETNRTMNDRGISWAISSLEPFTGKNYVVTTYNETEIKNIMLPISKTFNYSLNKRHQEFGFRNKLDVQRVLWEMVNFIHAILKGSFGDGQRNLLGKTHIQHENIYKDVSQQRQGVMGKVTGGLFQRGVQSK